VNERQVFVLAERALRAVVEQIDADQWDQIVPDAWVRHPDATLRDVVNYHACDDAWVPDVLAGRTAAEVGKRYDGDLLGADPRASFAAISETAIAAVEGFAEPDRIVHLSYGDYPAREYLTHITFFRGLRAYDLARFIGADTTLPDELVHGLWDEISPVAEEWRKLGVLGPEIAVGPDASPQERLLGLVGRQAA
jgi:uncharacterized protein (TIGR03086 family)